MIRFNYMYRFIEVMSKIISILNNLQLIKAYFE